MFVSSIIVDVSFFDVILLFCLNVKYFLYTSKLLLLNSIINNYIICISCDTSTMNDLLFKIFCSSHITFGVDSMHDMHMQASVEVISKSLYNEDAKHTPVLYGALDRRMVFKDCISFVST